MLTFQDLQEGVYDPNILKAFFLAGGPGSGKSYVVKRTTGGLGMKIVNSDDAFEKLLKDAGLSLKMPPEEEEPREKVRGRAKEITAKRKANYIVGVSSRAKCDFFYVCPSQFLLLGERNLS